MAGVVAKSIFPAKFVGAASHETITGIAGGTVYEGDVLKYSSGKLIRVAADDTTGIVGVATHGAVVNEALRYHPALPGNIFEATLEDETNNSHVLVQTNVGVAYAIQLDATNNRMYLDENDTSNGVGFIDEIVDPIGTTKARVRFHFEGASTVWAT